MIYLDNAATTYPKPDEVYRAVDRFSREVGASSGRGAYRRALDADGLIYEARKALALLLGVSPPSRIAFTPGVTWSLNMVLTGLVRPGDHVVTTGVEHNAVWRPLVRLGRQGALITVVPGLPDGTVPAAELIKQIDQSTRLVVMVHASNVTGAILPAGEVAEHCRRLRVPMVVDLAQTAGCLSLDGLEGCVLAVTGHKALLGPPGTGAMYLPDGIDPEPLVVGGTGEESRSDDPPELMPERYEAGTLNVPGIVGLGAGIRYLLELGVADVRRHEQQLTGVLLDRLRSIPAVTVWGPGDPERQVGVVSFTVKGWDPGEVASRLDRDHGIMVRAGLHCAPCCHRTIGTQDAGTVRVGLGPFVTVDDIEALGTALRGMGGRGDRVL